MSDKRIALAGIGKIAHEEHVPALAGSRDWDLAATISRNGRVDGVPGYHDLDAFFQAGTGIDAVSLAMPPGPRYEYAIKALEAGMDVMLEKPPAVTLAQCRQLCGLAADRGRVLYMSWHSRMGAAVDEAARRLRGARIHRLHIDWREDVRRTHAGQDWVWRAGNLGVFDPGINATSILVRILEVPPYPVNVEMEVPEGRETPITVDLTFGHVDGGEITGRLDWRYEGDPVWNMEIETDRGTFHLDLSGTRLTLDGEDLHVEDHAEYAHVYDRFADLVRRRESETDTRPLEMVADCFLIARRRIGAPFEW